MDSVAKLISLVKRRPPIYKYRVKKDKNKEVIDQLWREIAFEMGCSELYCRQKWAILRNCYARAIREERSLKTKKKSWYLQDKLSFLRDYINPHQKLKGHPSESSYTPNPPDHYPINVETSTSPPLLAHLAPSEASNSLATSIKSSPVTLFPAIDYSTKYIPHIEFPITADAAKYFPKYPPTDDTSNCSTVSIKSNTNRSTGAGRIDEPIVEIHQTNSNHELPDNSNYFFLTSLLPDLNKLSEKKQRVFKRKTMELLEVLFEEEKSNAAMDNSKWPYYHQAAINMNAFQSWFIEHPEQKMCPENLSKGE